MLKPFYNKKKNIDNRLLPSVTAADAGKVVGVNDEGKYALTEGGGGSINDILVKITQTGYPDFYVHLYTSKSIKTGSITRAAFATFLTSIGYANNEDVYCNVSAYGTDSVSFTHYLLLSFKNNSSITLTLQEGQSGKSDATYNHYQQETIPAETVTIVSVRPM